MWRELSVSGILLTPAVAYLGLAGLIYVPLRVVLVRTGLARWFWNFPMAGAALYLSILGALVRFL